MEFLQILISFVIFRYKEKSLEGYMNRLSLVLMYSVALMFAACGDSDDGASPQSNADMEVRTYSELPSCAEKRDGKTAYVADQEQGYVCQNGEWVEDDDVKVVSVSQSDVEGFLTDSRDGQTYRTVTIGFQTWMAENLNYKTANSYCYDNNANNCIKYGRLYTWNAAKTACPSGWHLPTQAEMNTLIATVGGANDASSLKSTSGWDDYNGENGNGTDEFSFSALPAGVRDTSGKFRTAGWQVYFWSSTEYESDKAFCMNLYYYNGDGVMLGPYYKVTGYSVRCIKDGSSNNIVAVIRSSSSVTPPKSSSSIKITKPVEVKTGSITDSRDGQSYKTVTIGTQTWMAQNLNYETVNSYCYDDNPANCAKYGRLYTWAAAMDSAGTWSSNGKGCGNGSTCTPTCPVRGVCPTGWHLPAYEEFETLFTAVGGSGTAGTKLKSTTGWNGSDNGTDAYSFSALPAGLRNVNEYYLNEGNIAFFWSSTEFNSNYAYYMSLLYDYGLAHLFYSNKDDGFSVRCVKD